MKIIRLIFVKRYPVECLGDDNNVCTRRFDSSAGEKNLVDIQFSIQSENEHERKQGFGSTPTIVTSGKPSAQGRVERPVPQPRSTMKDGLRLQR